jgi:neutral ceramidase
VFFEHDGQRLVLVSADLIGFYDGSAEILRQAILAQCQLQPAELFLSATHTHSAPTVTFNAAKGHSNNLAYSKLLEQKLVEVVQAAMAGASSARLEFGAGSSPVGVNRREVAKDQAGNPRIVLGRNPSASIDREVQVAAVRRTAGHELAAVLFGYATHSTSLGPRNYLVSGDVHGLAEQFIERHLGNNLVAPGFAGASGDIDPWYRVLPGFNTDNGWVPEPVLMGTMLGQEVVHVLARMQKPAAIGPVKSLFKTVQLPGKTKIEDNLNSATSKPFNISVARVGSIAFVGLGGEVFNEIGKAIKDLSPFAWTMVITHCNGAAGYLATEQSYAKGGYEVQSSPFAPGASGLILQHAAQLLAELQFGIEGTPVR